VSFVRHLVEMSFCRQLNPMVAATQAQANALSDPVAGDEGITPLKTSLLQTPQTAGLTCTNKQKNILPLC
jgi:hypothetical protein